MCAKRSDGPIFVVGSPRSGTSILTWCLGQHANILPQEESGWLGEFAVSLGVHFRTGTACGARSQLTSLGIDDANFFRTFGNCVNTMILNHRFRQEDMSRELGRTDSSQINPAFRVSRSAEEPKLRWVDGTPEYSYYIAGLRKLFPDAKFVHIVRDVRSVVDSMLNFRMSDGRKLVETEQQAYEYWLGTVQPCVHAESAYGPEVVHRLRYEDLLHRPEQTIRSVLCFLNETYMDACLQPLASKINSSQVQAGFDARESHSDMHVLERAWHLSDQLQQSKPVSYDTNETFALLEETFSKRVAFIAELGVMYAAAQRKVTTLTKRLNRCGVGLATNFLLSSIALYTLWMGSWSGTSAIATWFLSSSIGIIGYLAIRWAGLRGYGIRMLRRYHGHNSFKPPVSAGDASRPLRAQGLEIKKI